MILTWLPILILSASPSASTDHSMNAEIVYETDFGKAIDTNYDGWPDNWTRRRGKGYPQYVSIQIADDTTPGSQQSRCLRIDLDGGGAVAFSPPIEISPLFSYVFRGKIRTEGLTHDVAYFTISFFDEQRQHKRTFTSAKLTNSPQWQELRIGPATTSNPQARYVVIGLHLVPTKRADLTGSAMFDDLSLARLPNMTVETTQPHNLFSDPGAPEITCTVSGIKDPAATVLLELLDVSGNILATEKRQLTISNRFGNDTWWTAESKSRGRNTELPILATSPEGHAGIVTWRPRFPDYGFYRVRVSLRNNHRTTLQRTISLAILRDVESSHRGDFGWSLIRNERTISDDALIALLDAADVSWLKYPIWYSPNDEADEGKRIAALADRLSAVGIEMVGVFDRPPREVQELFGNKEHLTVAEAFLGSNVWQSALDPLLIQLSLKIRWWQLGMDDDESFIDYQQLPEKVEHIRAYLKKFGQRLQLGLAWQWMYEVPQSANRPWDFLARTEALSFTHTELEQYAKHSDQEDAHYFVTLWPLPKGAYDSQTRARDLVLRMLEAKIDGAEAIFAANPFDPTRGLLNEDGTPDDLFVPWSVTSRMLGGATYLGTLQLPNGSRNCVFARENDAVMIIWNATDTSESLYLGKQIRQTDPWGRATTLSRSDEPTTIQARSLPTFIEGLDLAVTRWRLSFSFQPNKLASMFGHQQTSQYQFHNSFAQGVNGNLQLHVPDVWQVDSPRLRFKLRADENLREDFHVLLQANASSGPQKVRVDFDILADKQYRFSVYRQIEVGLGDIIVELDTWIDNDGKLIVEQHLLNRTDQRLDFNCYLFAPGRRRMRMQVFDVGPGRVTHTFSLRKGRELLGKSLWLRVEELGGGRLYNYHVVAEP